MPRLPDWPDRLAAYIESRRHARFVWGAHDCCRFAAGAVEAITGDCVAGPWAPCRSAIASMRALRAAGGIYEIPSACGFQRIPPALAGRGDIVATLTRRGPALGVCLGADAAFAGTERLVFLPTLSSSAAWRIL